MAQDNTWVFRQLSGANKVITLGGWAAPHGRPRAGSVVRKPVNIRHRSTRYPGSNGPPTRHLFGYNYQDWELHGRFRTSQLGMSVDGASPSSALAMSEAMTSFVKDQQICDISWGSFVHVTGIISEFDPGLESPDEVEWKMKVLIDNDNFELKLSNPPSNKNINSTIDDINNRLGLINENGGIARPDLGVRVDVLELLDDIVSSVTGAVGNLVKIANTIDNLEQGVANSAKRLIAGIHQLKTALITLGSTLESAEQDTFFVRDSAADNLTYNQVSKSLSSQIDITLALLSDTENQAEATLKGEAKFTLRVQEGDTFESISTRSFGGPDKADDIRQANGYKYGRKPRVGDLLVIPGL